MTYLEEYRKLDSVEAIKARAVADTKVVLFLGLNHDRIKEIEKAMNQAINERQTERSE